MKRTILILAAIVCCSYGFSKKPQYPDSYNYQRGCELVNNEQWDEGIEILWKEVALNPKNGYAYAWLAFAYRQKDEKGSAVECAKDALKKFPKSEKYYAAWTHSLLSLIYWDMNDTVKAIQELTISIKTEPENEFWYERRGKLYGICRQWEKSDADFCKYIELKPTMIDGYMHLGYNYFCQERYEEALSKFSYANLLDQRAYTLSEMANCEVKLGMYEEAAEHVLQSLKQQTYEENCLVLLSSCKNEDFVDLMKNKLRVQIAKNPNLPEWMIYMVLLEDNQKQYEEAIRMCQRVRKIYPDASVEKAMADICCKMGDFSRALNHVNEAIKEDSTNIDYRISRVSIYREMDNIDAFYADINRLIEDNPEDVDNYSLRAGFNFFHHNYTQAVEDYDMVLAIDPSCDYERYMRGRCYEALGNTEKAKKDFLRVECSQNVEVSMFTKALLGKKEEAILLADSLLRADTIDYAHRYNVACLYALVGEEDLAWRYLEEELQSGYVNFSHLRLDPDFQLLHGEKFEQTIRKYEAICNERIERFCIEQGEESGEERVVEIPFTIANGVTKVDCIINGLPLNFVFDTGASDVTISQTEANFMFKNGYLKPKDIIGSQYYQVADGNVAVGTTFLLNKINFGGLELTGVRASVVSNQNAPLLLGQTVLQRLGKIEIDNERRVLKITTNQ
ncbi:MAG: retroviral-like aspartic protease family protein [Paludibacteraceae bacterium]